MYSTLTKVQNADYVIFTAGNDEPDGEDDEGDDPSLHDLVLAALGTDPRIPNAVQAATINPSGSGAGSETLIDADDDEAHVNLLLEQAKQAEQKVCKFMLYSTALMTMRMQLA